MTKQTITNFYFSKKKRNQPQYSDPVFEDCPQALWVVSVHLLNVERLAKLAQYYNPTEEKHIIIDI